MNRWDILLKKVPPVDLPEPGHGMETVQELEIPSGASLVFQPFQPIRAEDLNGIVGRLNVLEKRIGAVYNVVVESSHSMNQRIGALEISREETESEKTSLNSDRETILSSGVHLPYVPPGVYI